MSSCVVEQPVDGLEAEVRHPDPVGVGERQRDAQAIAVRLADVADFLGEDVVVRVRAVPRNSWLDRPEPADGPGGPALATVARPGADAQTTAFARAVDLSTLSPAHEHRRTCSSSVVLPPQERRHVERRVELESESHHVIGGVCRIDRRGRRRPAIASAPVRERPPSGGGRERQVERATSARSAAAPQRGRGGRLGSRLACSVYADMSTGVCADDAARRAIARAARRSRSR